MAQPGSQNTEWTEGWGVVREVLGKIEFVAFFVTKKDAEAAAEAQAGCQVCWLTYRVGFR
jgi:hypothetical protein